MTELKKVLKLRTVISTSAGMAIATSCYLAGIQVATILVGELAWISILVAGFLCLLSSHVLLRADVALPDRGRDQALHTARLQRAHLASSSACSTWCWASPWWARRATSWRACCPASFSVFDPFYDKLLWMLLFILLVGVINFRGVYITGVVQDILTYVMVGFMIAVSVYTFATHEINLGAALAEREIHLSETSCRPRAWVCSSTSGFEWVTPLAEETTDYRLIGKGMMWAIGLLSLTYALFIVAMYAGLTQEQLTSGTPHTAHRVRDATSSARPAP